MKQINKDLTLQHNNEPSTDLDIDPDDLLQSSRIHSLYQNLYLTDLKSEIDFTNKNLLKEKFSTLLLENKYKEQQKELESAKKALQIYRKIATEQQRQF